LNPSIGWPSALVPATGRACPASYGASCDGLAGINGRRKSSCGSARSRSPRSTGFIKKDEKGEPIGTGEDGCKGYLKWLALHEPRTYAALMARILPYYVSVDLPDDIMSHEETLAELRERGLPIELIQFLRKAPTRLRF
jgi:hypothetical protein